MSTAAPLAVWMTMWPIAAESEQSHGCCLRGAYRERDCHS